MSEQASTPPARNIAAVPEGYGTVTPWIVSPDTAGLIEFLKAAFGAEELARIPGPHGGIGHAEVRIGDSVVMMFDSREGWPATPGFLRLYVEDGDGTHRRALEAGATAVTEMTDLFFGDRIGRVRDPFGNVWWIQERVEEVDPAEVAQRPLDAGAIQAMRYMEESLDAAMRSPA
jgi:uncharacterized glyoxalase superfamily protein PhnB